MSVRRGQFDIECRLLQKFSFVEQFHNYLIRSVCGFCSSHCSFESSWRTIECGWVQVPVVVGRCQRWCRWYRSVPDNCGQLVVTYQYKIFNIFDQIEIKLPKEGNCLINSWVVFSSLRYLERSSAATSREVVSWLLSYKTRSNSVRILGLAFSSSGKLLRHSRRAFMAAIDSRFPLNVYFLNTWWTPSLMRPAFPMACNKTILQSVSLQESNSLIKCFITFVCKKKERISIRYCRTVTSNILQ